MKYLLDTDHISFVHRRAGQEYLNLAARMNQLPRTEFGYSIVSFHEQFLGAHAILNRARLTADVVRGYERMSRLLADYCAVTVVEFDAAAGAVFDGLQAQKVRIATMDLRIASIALSRQLTLLTRNSRDFQQVPGLTIEDWTI